MELIRRWLLPSIIDILTLLLQAYLYRYLREKDWIKRSAVRGLLLRFAYYALAVYMVAVFPEFVVPWHGLFSSPVLSWFLAGTMLWLVVLMSLSIWVRLHLRVAASSEDMSPGRRAFLRVAVPVVALAPSAIVAAGMIRARSGPKLKVVNIRLPGLIPVLNGIRI